MANTKLPPPAGRRAVDLAIVAKRSVWLTVSELAATRQRSFDQFPTPLRPQFLKHSDDQTLAALTALAAAIEVCDRRYAFEDWAIVSSTRYVGRAAFAAVIDKYAIDGPWGVSVQVIPHTAPHAVAATASLALGAHGPSIGAGAARGEESQALLAAASLLQSPDVGGTWVLLTGWSTEVTGALGQSETATEPRCAGVALAVVKTPPGAPDAIRSVGRIAIDACRGEGAEASVRGQPAAPPLTDLLAGERLGDVRWSHAYSGMHVRVELPAEDSLSSQPRVLRAA
jgi:hypothetical protein